MVPSRLYPLLRTPLRLVLLDESEGARTCLFAATSKQVDDRSWRCAGDQGLTCIGELAELALNPQRSVHHLPCARQGAKQACDRHGAGRPPVDAADGTDREANSKETMKYNSSFSYSATTFSRTVRSVAVPSSMLSCDSMFPSCSTSSTEVTDHTSYLPGSFPNETLCRSR